jgi:hypothetical protein
MLFALDRDNGGLLALSSPVEAAAHCKPIDVRDGYWLFFADDGSPLEARFDYPSHSEDSIDLPGPFTLERAISGLWLQERLDTIATVKGCGMNNVEEVVETLKTNRAKRALGKAGRG